MNKQEIYLYFNDKNCKICRRRIYKERIQLSLEQPKIKTSSIYLDWDDRDDTYLGDKRGFKGNDGKPLNYLKWYNITNSKCPGDKFKVISMYKSRRPKNAPDDYEAVPRADVYTLSGAILHIPQYKVFTGDIFDPYYRTMWGDMCCIGNIKWYPNTIDTLDIVIGMVYKTWKDYMRRCYDTEYPMYNVIGSLGMRPLYPKWHCFEFFMQDNENLIKNGNLPITDTNDPMLYQLPAGCEVHTEQLKRTMSRLPYANDYVPSITLPARIREVPIDQRTTTMLKSPGRPATGRKRKKLMYKLLPEE